MSGSGSGPTYLVTGATGKIGTRVVERLLRRGERTRVFVRDAGKARKLFGDRVDVTVGDFGDRDSLSRAVDGVGAMFLVTTGRDLAEKDHSAAAAAKSAGVQSVVKLSTADVALNVGTGPWHRDGEAAIRDSGIGFIFVQPSGFMDNVLRWADSIKADGIVRCCAGDGRIPFIHSDDIADMAIEAMTSPRCAGRSLPITGPEALSFADVTESVGSVIGRQLRFEPISDEQERRQQIAWGTPGPLVEARLGIFRAMRAGQLAGVTTNVAAILGRDPIPFSRWAEQNVAAFR